MNGQRKFRFARYGLSVLCVGYAVSVWRHVPADLFSAFAWGVVGIVGMFGGANAGEHLAEALKNRAPKEPKA